MGKIGLRWLCLLLTACLWPAFAAGEAAFGACRAPADAAYLDLGETQVTDWPAFFTFLDGFPSLQKVDMFATPVQKEQIDLLTARYPGVAFGWTIQFAEHTVRTDATAFSTLHLSGAPTHSTETLSVLAYCKQLRALDIGHNYADDLSFIAALPELRVLIIACNRFTDLTPLANLKHLEYLEMFSNRVVDISPLAELPYLAHLNIGYNDIRDISPLYNMPQLKRLWMLKAHSRLKAKPLSDATMATLREALPGCEINVTSSPSEGGWRDEAHFAVFHDYFRSGVYRPFADSPLENR